MIVIATLFRKLETVKDFVRTLFKKHRFRNSFDNQHVKESQSYVKYAWEHFDHIFSSLWETLIWKISPLVICWILGVFRNTLTANDKYPVRDCQNLSSPIQLQLSLNPKAFFILLFHFWNLNQILNILKKKMIVIATLFRKLQTVKDLVRPLFKKHHFRNSFDNQHVKESQVVWNLPKCTFIIFFHHYGRPWFGKYLP